MSILLTIAIVGVLILLHEAGHYLVARACGMRVDRFSIGFGPVVASFRPKRSETTFQIGALPLGGYVQIAGMDPSEEIPDSDQRAYSKKPLWQRALVVFAGPAANYLLAALTFAALFVIGFPMALDEPVIGEVAKGGPAQAAGLRVGDRISAVDGRPVMTWTELASRISKTKGPTVSLVLAREGVTRTLEVRPRQSNGRALIGIGPSSREERRPIGSALVGGFSAAGAACLQIVRSLGQGLGNLVGPLGIIKVGSAEVQRGLRAALSLAAGLSAALAVMNFLPLPALDGGRIVFLGYEAVARRRAPPKLENRVHWVGMMILLGLLLLVSYRDVLSWISGG